MSNRSGWVDLLIVVIGAVVGAGIGVWGTIYVTREDRKANEIRQRQLDERQARAEYWMTHLADGSYEWQWAPEGWLGTIDVTTPSKGEKSATINIDKFCPGSLRAAGKALESRGKGKIEENVGNRGMIRLTLPITINDYDPECHLTSKRPQTLIAMVYPREAYEGTVTYKDKFGSSKGGIMLLNHQASPRETQ